MSRDKGGGNDGTVTPPVPSSSSRIELYGFSFKRNAPYAGYNVAVLALFTYKSVRLSAYVRADH